MALIDDFEVQTYPAESFPAMDLGYFALPFLIFAAFFTVYAYSYRFVKEA